MATQDLTVVLAINDEKYSAAIQRARTGINRLQRDMQASGHATVSAMQASSAAIRTVEGNIQNNVRAVERFLTMIPGVGEALKAAFPVIGAIAFAGVVSRDGKEFLDTADRARDAGRTIRDSFAQSAIATQEQNAALELTNAHLEDQIAKLRGQPTNGLKEQLIETRIEALKLAAALDSDATKLQALIKENGVGVLGMIGAGLLGGHVASTNGVTSSLSRDAFENQRHAYDIQQADLTKNPDTIASAVKSATDALQRQINGYQVELQRFQALAKRGVPGQYDANINFLQAAIEANRGQLTGLANRNQNIGLQGSLASAQGDKSSQDAADNALADRLKFRDKLVETYNKQQEDDRKQVEEMSKIGDEMVAKATEQDNKFIAEKKRLAEQLAKYQDDLADIQRNAADSVAQQGIEFARASGQITAHAAALALADLHTRQYAQSLSDLQAQQRAADNAGDTQESQRVGRQIAELNANRGVQVGADQNAISGTTLKYQLGEFANALSDTTDKLRSLIENTINSFNDDLLNGKGFKNTALDAARGFGKMGLENVEGRALNAFGLGGAFGKLGTQGNPIWTRSADTGTGASVGGFKLPNLPGFGGEWGSDSDDGNGGGFFGGLASIFSGKGYADGGSPPVGMASIVGERGPELFVPKSAGTIVSNSKLRGGGDTHYHDFRGANFSHTDPNMVQKQIMAVAPQIVAASVKSVHERQVRRPSTRR